MTVARILARKGRDVATIPPEASLREVVEILADKHIGSIVVLGLDGHLAGIVSERDVVRALAKCGVDALDHSVADHMTRNVVTASEDDGVLEIAQTMSTGRFRHMPVVSNGRVVGIVSTGDAIKYRLEQLQRDQEALREYIATA